VVAPSSLSQDLHAILGERRQKIVDDAPGVGLIGIRLMRSLSVSENAREEKLTISWQTGLGLVLFFRKTDKPDWRFLWATRDQGFGNSDRGLFNDSNDSGMAPQAIEITQNGLGRPARSGCWEGESIRRIPC
jgi:hypothetical protein